MNIRVIVNGARGKMGQLAVKAINECPTLDLVGETGKQDNLADIIGKSKADVVVDLTSAECAYENALTIIMNNAHPVIGTTGFSSQQIEELQKLCLSKKLGGIIAPNFSLSAVLMMHFAAETVKHLPHVEIIEMHHDNKKDAPSGTAVKTAELLSKNRTTKPTQKEEKILVEGVRGGLCYDIPIHSIRLPGLVAHQEILFGGDNETLTFRHDTINRAAFMPGILLSCHKILKNKELLYGLENLLFTADS